MKYMDALMHDETRFWIAQQVSGTKYTADISPLFRKAKDVAGKRPNVLISDGMPNYSYDISIPSESLMYLLFLVLLTS
jgi:hypothetical protein